MLRCFLEDGKGGYLKPRLVTLDDLDTTSGRAVFLEDRRSERLLAYCKDARNRWWKAMQAAREDKPKAPFYSDKFDPAWASVRALVPALSDWKEDYWETHKHRGQPHLASLFAILCSVAHSAEAGADTLYITRHAGDGALLAMLNSKLSSAEFAPYADMIETFLGATAKADLLTRPSLQKMLTNARAEHGQVDSDHPIWSAAARMFPETLDGLVRAELSDLGRLPAWAIAAP